MDIIKQIEFHLNRLGLSDIDPVNSIAVYEEEPGIVRLADDNGEWIGQAEVALERLASRETLTWEEFWEIFQD